MCSHEHFCPDTAEHCIKTAACNQDITSQLVPISNSPRVSEFQAPTSMYFHGFEVSNTVNTTLTIQFGNSTNQAYYESGQGSGMNNNLSCFVCFFQTQKVKIYRFTSGRQRRFFAWPIIASTIRLVFSRGSRTVFGLRILGGGVENCRLHNELSGRNWWKLIKVDARSATLSEVVSTFGVQNDFDPQSREVDFSLSSSQYKNKLVDEWETLGIKLGLEELTLCLIISTVILNPEQSESN